MKTNRVAIFFAVVVTTCPAQQVQNGPPSVCGYVVDSRGDLVSSAEVRAASLERGGLVPSSMVQSGKFCISLGSPGRYRLYAFTKTSGYRNVGEALFQLDPEAVPEVVVSERTATSISVVRLGPGSAKLTAKLVDSENGRPLTVGKIILTRADRSNGQFTRPVTYLDKNSEISLLVPSLPLRLQASAPGYGVWSFHEISGSAESDILFLPPNKNRELIIRLKPLRPQPKQ